MIFTVIHAGNIQNQYQMGFNGSAEFELFIKNHSPVIVYWQEREIVIYDDWWE